MENVDKLKLLVQKLDLGVELGEKILADGKVDFMDAVHAPELIKQALDLFKHFKDHREEMLAEIKDIDFAEGVELLNEANK
tara:strand:- start:1144 stop:1386 length:243 start_codon:yes stop_codon:yes gene_type:complete